MGLRSRPPSPFLALLLHHRSCISGLGNSPAPPPPPPSPLPTDRPTGERTLNVKISHVGKRTENFVRSLVREEDESAAKEGRKEGLPRFKRGFFKQQPHRLSVPARMHANAELTLVPRRSERRREDERSSLTSHSDSRRQGEREKTTRRRRGGRREEAMHIQQIRRGGETSNMPFLEPPE